jgi:acyl carrier protein
VTRDIQNTIDKEKLRTLIAEVLELPVEEVTDDADFNQDLGVYSLLAMEVILRVEKDYGIKIAESEMDDITSLNRAYELVTTKLQAASP